MAANRTSTGIAQLVRVLRTHGSEGQTDGQLLGQFLAQRDEAAFVTLVRRHGSMVLGVCLRILGNRADAEDAFQATFLVLVRRAASLTARAVLGDWLHGVARRTALNARRACARRRIKEQAMARPEVQGEVASNNWLPLLDEELSHLPENYRLPIVMCDLEGRTRREAAERLGWPPGTVAGRLARGRNLLAKRLAQHGVVLSAGSLALALAQQGAAVCVSETLVALTTQAARLLAAGTGTAMGAISAKVAALTEGVVNAMFWTKFKKVTLVLGMAILLGVGGVTLVPGNGHQPMANAETASATAQKVKDAPKVDPEVDKLVRQLGSPSFAKRQAAEKALGNMGVRAAAAILAGMRDADAEIAKRCTALWPRLWATEIARPDGERLPKYAHPLWVRFRGVAGDDPSSRILFAEMVADVRRFTQLEAIEADPARAAAAYAAELKKRVEGIERGYREAEAASQGLSGWLWPSSGILTRGEFAALLFLGTYPSTAAVTYLEANDNDRVYHHNVFAMALHPSHQQKASELPPAVRRLYAAWLETRTDPNPIQFGMHLALHHKIAEVTGTARALAANAQLDPRPRGFALLAVGRFGTIADLPLLEKAFADSRLFHTTNYTETGKKRAVNTQVSDAAVAAALQLTGQHPADFGFPLLEMYKVRGPETLTEYHSLGFFDDATRQVVHKKAQAWLDKRGIQLFDGKTVSGWKAEGEVRIVQGLLKVGGAKGGRITSEATSARGLIRWSFRQAGEAKTTMTWRGEERRLSAPKAGWVTEEYEPAAPGKSPIVIVAPPGTTLEIRDFAFLPQGTIPNQKP